MPRLSQRDIARKNLFKRRRIAVIAVPPVEELDLVGPMQVFSAANRLACKPVYAVEIATSADDLKVPGEGGLLSFLAQRRFSELKGSFDSLLLVCGVATRNARDAALFAWLRKMACEVRRLGSVCVGAFLFAEAGLLNGKRATAHWKFGEELAKRYPRVRVESDPLWVKDGNIYTSAGISAGIDLALAWVEERGGGARSGARVGLVLAPSWRPDTVQRLPRWSSFGDESDPGASSVDRGKRSKEIVSANARGSPRHECSQF
jgi:transcriptional regulator GlxA family with amidase domain